MSSFINNLRQRPRDVRNKIAIISAMSLTFIIVLIWLLVVKNGKTNEDINKRSAGEDLKPLMMIFSGFKDGVSESKANISNEER